MGAQSSKEEHSAELKIAVNRVKSCLSNHHSNVCSIDSAVHAQNESVELLSQMRNDFGESPATKCEQSKDRPVEITQNLLGHIQNTLLYQVAALNESFDILDNCIKEISAQYSPDSGSPVDTEKRSLVSAKTRAPKYRNESVTYESESRRNTSEFGTSQAEVGDGDIDNTVRVLRAENKAIISAKSEFQMKLKESQEIVKSFQGENRNKSFEIEKLHRTIKYREEEINRVQKQKEELQQQKAKFETENKKLNAEILKHRTDANTRYSLETQLRRTENTNRNLQETVDHLRRRLQDLEDEKRKMKERQTVVPVQLFFQRRDDLMTLVVNELSAMLETQLQTKNIQLEIVRCEKSASIQPDKPILVLCINSSRLGTDASTAIEGVHKSGRTALLIFHHKNIHALPNQPSDRMLTSSEFKQLGGIYDLAFLTGKGIYPCDMNNLAVTCIEGFIQRNIPGK